MEDFRRLEEDFDLIRRRFSSFRLSLANRSKGEMATELAEYDRGINPETVHGRTNGAIISSRKKDLPSIRALMSAQPAERTTGGEVNSECLLDAIFQAIESMPISLHSKKVQTL
jgi:hypothetical protein